MSESESHQQPQDSAPEPAPRVEPPGRRLRETREAAGLSREEVAAKLRLQVKLVAALEEDDFEHLPPPTFVIGYLRSYARLLSLPDGEIVDAYQGQEPEAPGLKLNIEHGSQVRSSDLPVKLVTYLIVAALVVLLGIWWGTRHKETTPPTEPSASSAAPGNGELPLPAQAPASVGDGGSAVPSDTGAAAGADSAAAQTGTASAGAGEAKPTEAQPAPAEAPATAEQSTTPTETKSEEKAPETPTPPPLTPATPQSKLVLKFNAECWTEITDADGRRLAYALEPANKTVTLYGVAPFKVFLGYAPGVKVTYNGVPFDHSPYHHQEIARFTLGRPEDNHPRSEAN